METKKARQPDSRGPLTVRRQVSGRLESEGFAERSGNRRQRFFAHAAGKLGIFARLCSDDFRIFAAVFAENSESFTGSALCALPHTASARMAMPDRINFIVLLLS